MKKRPVSTDISVIGNTLLQYEANLKQWYEEIYSEPMYSSFLPEIALSLKQSNYDVAQTLIMLHNAYNVVAVDSNLYDILVQVKKSRMRVHAEMVTEWVMKEGLRLPPYAKEGYKIGFKIGSSDVIYADVVASIPKEYRVIVSFPNNSNVPVNGEDIVSGKKLPKTEPEPIIA